MVFHRTTGAGARAGADRARRAGGLPVGAPVFGPHGGHGPRFVVTVDTEEEFDWNGPFTRDQHDTTHASHLERFQQFCEPFAVQPIYLVDYPMLRDEQAVRTLARICASGRGAVGAQLHPWVNPPFEEAVTVRNSYACNLPPALERAKLTALCDMIVQRIGVRPEIYRAGRYGAGPASPAILQDLGIRLDSSVRALFDYRAQSGPDYTDAPQEPFWIVPGRLAELPLTTVFCGPLRPWGRPVFPLLSRRPVLRGALARAGLLERVALTPEGTGLAKAIEAIDVAIAMGLPLLNFSFHSPSLRPGHTPYVRTRAELDGFYDWWRAVFAHLAARGVRPVSQAMLIEEIFGN